jgi:hypothetical protein
MNRRRTSIRLFGSSSMYKMRVMSHSAHPIHDYGIRYVLKSWFKLRSEFFLFPYTL